MLYHLFDHLQHTELGHARSARAAAGALAAYGVTRLGDLQLLLREAPSLPRRLERTRRMEEFEPYVAQNSGF